MGDLTLGSTVLIFVHECSDYPNLRTETDIDTLELL